MTMIQGQGALVTGASRGLGRAVAEALALLGARVAMVARDPGPLGDAVATLRARSLDVHAIAADLGTKDAIHRIAGQAHGLVGDIAIAVHNASTLGPTPLGLLLDTECEDLERVLAVNLVGPFRLTKVLAGAMALQGAGTIVHVSSDAAVETYARWGAYSIAKAAQDHLSRILAAELADTGVTIVAVDPGEMDTAMHAAAIPEADRATLARPEDVAAKLVAMIECGEWVTGSRVKVGG